MDYVIIGLRERLYLLEAALRPAGCAGGGASRCPTAISAHPGLLRVFGTKVSSRGVGVTSLQIRADAFSTNAGAFGVHTKHPPRV